MGQLTTASPSFPSVIGITALCTTPSPPPLLSGICDGELHPETKQAATAAAPNSLALPSARADARLWLNAQQTRIASAALARAHYPLRSALLSARADAAAAALLRVRVVWCCVVLRRACLLACCCCSGGCGKGKEAAVHAKKHPHPRHRPPPACLPLTGQPSICF